MADRSIVNMVENGHNDLLDVGEIEARIVHFNQSLGPFALTSTLPK
jgi:hypothetical protein